MQAARTAAVSPRDEHRSRVSHLNQIELARRWRISPRTLERWRWIGEGPAYLKLGGSVAYRLEDVLAYEAAQPRPAMASRISSRG